MHNSYIHTSDLGDPFGMIHCPKCNMFWLKEFVPTHCAECGTKVADKPGTGFAESVRLARLGKLPVTILRCPTCKLEYPIIPENRIKKCFRCNHALVNATPFENVFRKIIFRNRFLFKFFWRLDRIRGLHKPKY